MALDPLLGEVDNCFVEFVLVEKVLADAISPQYTLFYRIANIVVDESLSIYPWDVAPITFGL